MTTADLPASFIINKSNKSKRIFKMKKQLFMALSCIPFLCTLLMGPLVAAAPAQTPVSSDIQQIIAEKLEREQADQDEFENSEEEIAEDNGQADEVIQRGFFYNEKEPVSTHNGGAWHFATSVSGTGSHVFLEEGSGWMIAQSDAKKTLDWMGDDIIWVTTAPWYSFYGYVLHNYNTGVKVYADLKERPSDFNAYTLYITEINVAEKSLVLSDRTVWTINCCYDARIASTWRVGQKVLIGINTSFWTSSKSPNLLISTEKGIDGYIRARCQY
jgi:hypothetical protein